MRRKLLASFGAVALLAALAVGVGYAAMGGGRSTPPGSGMMGDGSGTGMMGDGSGTGMMSDGSGTGMMGDGSGTGMMGDGFGPGMMGSGQGAGPVHGLADASSRAQAFACDFGLHVGEVIQFKRNYYASLLDPDGNGATEVLVLPQTGAVWLEYGPAMMWNTSFGMMGADMMGSGPGTGGLPCSQAGSGTGAYDPAAEPTVSAADAVGIASRWLAANRPDLRVEDADSFPGYYTLETLRGDSVAGMLSVNAYSGAVWYHTWHGSFVAMTE
jgi:hypothetical protein